LLRPLVAGAEAAPLGSGWAVLLRTSSQLEGLVRLAL
jgi:hypothetical protein